MKVGHLDDEGVGCYACTIERSATCVKYVTWFLMRNSAQSALRP